MSNNMENIFELEDISVVLHGVRLRIGFNTNNKILKLYRFYFESLMIEIGGCYYNIYAEFKEEKIVGEMTYETIKLNTELNQGKTLRFLIKIRIGNQYFTHSVYLKPQVYRLEFAHDEIYNFSPVSEEQFLITDYTYLLPKYIPLEKKNNIELNNIVTGNNYSEFTFNLGKHFFDNINIINCNFELFLVWKSIKTKQGYYFHTQEVCKSEFTYYLCEDELNKLNVLEFCSELFDWFLVDNKGNEYPVYFGDNAVCRQIKIPVRDYCIYLLEKMNSKVQLKITSGIFFALELIEEQGNAFQLTFFKRSYHLNFVKFFVKRVNTENEYEVFYSIIYEDDNRIIFKLVMDFEIDIFEFKSGIHQFFVEIQDGGFNKKQPIKLFNSKNIKENIYLVSYSSYVIIDNKYFATHFYNDTSYNLKCNIIPRKLKIIIQSNQIMYENILINLRIYKEPFFENISNVFLEDNGNRLLLVNSKMVNNTEVFFEICVEIEISKLVTDEINNLYRLLLEFEGRNSKIYVENNYFKPSIAGRETVQFSNVLVKVKNEYIKISANQFDFSYAINISKDMKLLSIRDCCLVEGVLSFGIVQILEKEETVGNKLELILENKITFNKRKYTLECINGIFEGRIPIQEFDFFEYNLFCQYENGMVSYLESDNDGVVLYDYNSCKKITLKKNNKVIEFLVSELLLYENDNLKSQCLKTIESAKLNNQNNQAKIWFIGENYGLSARDNGLAFFEYCIKNNNDPMLKVFYVTKKHNPDIYNLEEFKDQVIFYDSMEHIFYNELVEFYIVSHGIRDVMPSLFHNQIGKYNKPIIYLQHGLAAMKKFEMSNKSYGGNIKKFVVSSEKEKQLLIRNRQFYDEELIVTGLARYDKLEKNSTTNEKYIWIMPTWRDWLIKSNEMFTETAFYRNYCQILNNIELTQKLKNSGMKIVFSLHSEFSKFKCFFEKCKCDVIDIVDMNYESVDKQILNCCMMITDYSSIVFDALYSGKPVIFFQFDYQDYDKYRGSYVDMKSELPGDVVYNEEDLLLAILKLIDNKFELSEVYEDKRDSYFKYYDNSNSQRIFNSILTCRKELSDEN